MISCFGFNGSLRHYLQFILSRLPKRGSNKGDNRREKNIQTIPNIHLQQYGIALLFCYSNL